MTLSIFNKHNDLKDLIEQNSIVLHGYEDMSPLMEHIGDAKYVLLGEASHGTHEYYTWRMQISKRLIEEKNFSFIAVEGDWPDCYRVNRYVKQYENSGSNALDVLKQFSRWPTWMWANWEITALAEWLREYNKKHGANPIGFYGLDVYSLWESLDAILHYLDKHKLKTKETALHALKCFQPYSGDEQAYAHATMLVPSNCEKEVVQLLREIRSNTSRYDGDKEAAMSAEQNAFVAVNAEAYYRAMVRPGPHSWNIRDHHMVDTLQRLMEFHGPDAKAIVWEHNTHIGDARATDMAAEGLVNVGQLVREQQEPGSVYSVGFGSYKGTVIAGEAWGDPMKTMKVPEARTGSWEQLLHEISPVNRLLLMSDALKQQINQTIPHRAIGVVYRPAYERYGNYVPSRMPYRYDAFIYLDETRALHPLHASIHKKETPETYPFGF
jgi:erythromycin esterase-like protein